MAGKDKASPTGCCGLSFLKRPLRSKEPPDRQTDAQVRIQEEAPSVTVNSRDCDIKDNNSLEYIDQDGVDDHPINLKGISLHLNIVSNSRIMDSSFEKPDSRLDEFKQIFCGGNELHSVDFIRIWGFYDKDHSGYLETKELDKFIKDLILEKGKKPFPDMVKDVREAVLRSADLNKDGKIELSEFARCLPVEKNFFSQFDRRNVLTRNDFNDIFQHYDPDNNGLIEGDELMALLRDILTKKGQHAGANDLIEYRDHIIKSCDTNHDGKLSRDELGMLLSINK